MQKDLLVTKNYSGFSLVEAIVAAAIFSIITTSIVASYVKVSSYILASGVERQAIFMAQEGLEAVRNIQDNNFVALTAGGPYGISTSGNVWNIAGSSDTTGIYTRKINVTAPDTDTWQVASRIEWTYKGENKNLTLNREFTNWRKAKNIDPISRWPFDENVGCTASDEIGSNDGVLMPASCPTGSPIWISGTNKRVGTAALNFNSTGTYNFVQISDDNSLDLSTSGTIMAWIYPTASAVMGIVHKGTATNGSDEAYYLRMDANRRITGGGRNSAGTQVSVQTTTAVSTNAWNHVAFTWDATGMKIYIGGVLRTNANTTVLNARNSSNSLQIGGYYTSTNTNRFRGRIDEVSLYNVALSATEISTIFASQ